MLQSHSPVTKPSSFYGVTFRSVGPYHRLQSIFLALRSRLECVRTFRSRQSDHKKLVAKGEIMFKVKQLGVAAAITLFAGAAMASNFRAADQVYVPAAGHISSASATFVSDVFISNLSDDRVDISVILATGTGGTQIPFPKVLTLAARERRELRDFVKNTLNQQSALGQLIFNACKSGADCTPDPTTGFNTNYRNISVETRIYSVALNADTNTAPTTGQLFSGIPWYNFVSQVASGAGLDKVFITGIRNTDQYRTNIGFVNGSQFSTTTITGTLFSATGTQLAQSSFTLQPLGSAQTGVGSASL